MRSPMMSDVETMNFNSLCCANFVATQVEFLSLSFAMERNKATLPLRSIHRSLVGVLFGAERRLGISR